MLTHHTDFELVQHLRAGDTAAFEGFFADYFPRLYRFLLARVERDVATAEELTQQVLYRALRGFEQYRGEASLYTWLCQIARHELSNHWARAARDRQHVVYPEDDAGVRAALESLEGRAADRPEQMATRLEMARLVQVALDSLPPHYATALEWKYIDGCSVNEIAERLDQTFIATQSVLARARAAFRESFESLCGRTFDEADLQSAGGLET